MRNIRFILNIISWILLSVGFSHGSGLGIGMPAFFGIVDYDFYSCNVKNIDIGFVFDNNVAKNSEFNY